MHSQKRIGLALFAFGLLLILTVFLAKPGLASPAAQQEGAYQAFLTTVFSAYEAQSSTASIPFIQHAGTLLPYNGAATCLQCHQEEVHDFGTSNHYLWQGKFGALNDFCEYPDINFGPGKISTMFGALIDGGCATCHAGLGALPTANNPENADCLTCHAVEYRRTLVKVNNVWRFAPNYKAMPKTITIQEEPTRAACLTCHATSGGGQNNKRGDMSLALANPTEAQDVHMGNGMTCVDCHQSQDHRIAGQGMDLRMDEGTPMVECTECHSPNEDHNEEIRQHLAKVACQSCHIPTYARVVSTDMLRDYREAEINPRGLWEPKITRQSNVTPGYGFWNGDSEFYEFRDPAVAGQLMAWPLGGINDGKLYPLRLHNAILPQDVATQAILPVKSAILFQTGNIPKAIITGARETGFSLLQGYTFVNVQRYMGIFHEMPPAEQALECAACHDSSNRVDFSALGYDPRELRNGVPLCTSCHEPEDDPLNFYQLHEKHVDDKNIACNTCHEFTR